MFSGLARKGTLLAPRAEPAPLGSARLDRLLGGGVPRGQVVEVSGASSSGKATLAFAVCQRALERGQAAAWIDPGGTFWPLVAVERGVPVERLLVVRVNGQAAALRAAHILLASAGAVAVVVVDLPPGASVRDRELVALQRLAERSASALLFLTSRARTTPSLGAQVAVRLHVDRRGGNVAAPELSVSVLRHKQGVSQREAEEAALGPDRLRLHCSP
jgi:recombination protein RecA